MLLVLSTHPIQYQAPIYRTLQSHFDIPTTVIYGSDFSVTGYHDSEFNTNIAWDTDLLSGYNSIFLSRTLYGESNSDKTVHARGIWKVVHSLNPKAVLLLGYRPRYEWRAFLTALSIHKPLLFRAEVTDHALHRSKLKSIARDIALRMFYRRFSSLLYIGKYAKGHFERLGVPCEKLYFSPYCVDTSPFHLLEGDREPLRKQVREHFAITEDTVVIVVVGKLIKHKLPDLILHAIKKLSTEIIERLAVLYVGEGEERNNLQALAAEFPIVKTYFAGFQNQSQISAYYHAGDVSILSSISETWGLVVNEALHHGIPVLVSNGVGSAPDLIIPGVTGEIFQVGSADSLQEALMKYLNWPHSVEQIRTACEEKVSYYSVFDAAQGIASAYQEATT